MKIKHITCNRAEQIIACAQLILENDERLPARPEKIEEMKAALREVATRGNQSVVVTALWWMATKMRDDLERLEQVLQKGAAQIDS